MKRILRLLWVVTLLALGAQPHAQEPRSPCALAEVDSALASGGIGGTGILAQEGGIGGTGIVGTVTGFGSLCVNGVEVHYESTVPVTWNGLPADAAELAVGQVVAAEVLPAATGLQAQSIAILAAVAGPADAVEQDALTVLGVRVVPGPRAIVVDGAGQPIALSALRPGDPVVVSGLRRPDDTIVATRIERVARLRREGRAPPPAFSPRVTRLLLEGYIERYAARESLEILGLAIRATAATAVAGAPALAGERAFVVARAGADGTWVAERVVVPQSSLRLTPRRGDSPERRTLEPPSVPRRIEPRMEPRFEPRFPSPGPGSPGRMGR
jgi:hypothetical protein